MNLEDHENSGRMKVWLDTSEVDEMISAIGNTQKEIAISLGVRCGLRSKEWLDVTPRHVRDTSSGWMLRVPDGKGGKYRETPIPEHLAAMIRAAGDYTGGPDSPVLQVESTRTLRRWVNDIGVTMSERSGDPGWLELSTHDLRRTWATGLADNEVDPLMALKWGGWNDLDTFLDHYKGPYSPEAIRDNRAKVEWL